MKKGPINILFISHLFPPVGGAGVQRSSKFVKYLPDFDFNPIVITSAVAGSNKWTPADASLNSDLDENIKIFRLPDDPAHRVTSNTKENPERTHAISLLADKVIETYKISLVYVSLSPFGDLAAAKKIANKHSIPVVADLRDPWAFDEFQSHPSFLHRLNEKRLMRKSLRNVDVVVMNTPTSAKLVSQNFENINRDKVEWITNGYDKDDFSSKNNESILDSTKFNIVHTGTFHTDYSIRQKKRRLANRLFGKTQKGIDISGRTPEYLFQAIQIIRKHSPKIANSIHITLAGVSSRSEKELCSKYELDNITTFTGYIDHSKSIEFLKSSNLLFLPLHQLPDSVPSTIVPGKAYEYLASGKPILAALPKGDARSFVKMAKTGLFSAPTDVTSIERNILKAFNEWKNDECTAIPNFEFIQQFERKKLTERLANIFKKTLAAN